MNRVILGCLALLSCSANATSDIKTAVSGYISGTLVSDPSFYSHTAKGAMNFDVTKGTYAFHTQLASSVEFPTESMVSRLTLEKAVHLGKGQEMSFVVGRYPRLFSFYNAITDSVGTPGLAMLPLAQYKRRYVTDSRMISGDGVMVNYRFHEDDYSLDFTADVNQVSRVNSCLVQMEIYNKSCRSSYGYTSDNPNFDFGLEYNSMTLKVLAAITFIDIKSFITDATDPVASGTYTSANKFSHRLYKLGVIKNEGPWWVQAEATYRDIEKAVVNKDLEEFNKQMGGYVIGGHHFSDTTSAYMGYSISRSSRSNYYNLNDYFAGVTYTAGGGLTYSLEYHNGNGKDWNRYLSPESAWSSAVLSITKQF